MKRKQSLLWLSILASIIVFILVIIVSINSENIKYSFFDKKPFEVSELAIKIERNDHDTIPYKFLPGNIYVIYAGLTLNADDYQMLAALEWLSYQYTWSKKIHFVAFSTLSEEKLKEHQDMAGYNPMYTVLCRQNKVVTYLKYKAVNEKYQNTSQLPLLAIIKNNDILELYRGYFDKNTYKNLIPILFAHLEKIEAPPTKAKIWKKQGFKN